MDVKAGGTGYICWPGTPGYEVVLDAAPLPAPMDYLNVEGKGAGDKKGYDSWVSSILSATELYPSFRAYSMHLASKGMNAIEIMETLRPLLGASIAATAGHARHTAWLNCQEKLGELIVTAVASQPRNLEDVEWALLAKVTGESLFKDLQPPEEGDGEGENEGGTPEWASTSIGKLRKTTIPGIKWLVKEIVPKNCVFAFAGASNVGKTRFLAMIAGALASGDTESIGMPAMKEGVGIVWVANEENEEDIRRRIKAAALHYGWQESKDIIIRGNQSGNLRLIQLGGTGNPEFNTTAIKGIVNQVKLTGAKVVLLDPYVTLGSDEGVLYPKSSTCGGDAVLRGWSSFFQELV